MAISGHNDKILYGYSVNQCKTACANETAFLCRSFDYDLINWRCFLSRKVKSDEGIKMVKNVDFNYFERIVVEKVLVIERKTSCQDLHQWTFQLNNKSYGCSYFIQRSMCLNGDFTPKHQFIGGKTYNFPELSCCKCGKGKNRRTYFQSPSIKPNMCTHKSENNFS